MDSGHSGKTDAKPPIGVYWFQVTRPAFGPLFKAIPFVFAGLALVFLAMFIALASRGSASLPADVAGLRKVCQVLIHISDALLLATAITCVIVFWLSLMVIGFAKIHRQALARKRRK